MRTQYLDGPRLRRGSLLQSKDREVRVEIAFFGFGIWLLLERRELPREVAWCTPDLLLHATDLPTERARLHAALKRCPVLQLAALSWAALLSLVVLLPLVQLMLRVGH